jgi:hypothetical protein
MDGTTVGCAYLNVARDLLPRPLLSRVPLDVVADELVATARLTVNDELLAT